MVPIMSIALAIALTYVVGDLYAPFLPRWASWAVDFVVCLVLYRFASRYLTKLKE